ncbi:EAL domain-containing protein [Neorhizobium sp. T6_25]|uniref:bifunctional diguanylate cyclase/phosphodiesterase n=1 Tax=Neorhizobium sp. T6_25 TaxID=2093833 RepID=UPI00155F07F5|nr:EAL domain-containing protein [Neorhizobium sp. T6_25]
MEYLGDIQYRRSREQLRFREVHNFRFLGAEIDPALARIAELSTGIFDVASSMILLNDGTTQHISARAGLAASKMTRDLMSCTERLVAGQCLVVPDASVDLQLKDDPLVIGEPSIRFYVSVPIVSARSQVIGSLCIFDTRPRLNFPKRDQENLKSLARLVTDQLETKRLSETRRAALCLNRTSPDAILHISSAGTITYANRAARTIFGFEKNELIGASISILLPPRLQRKMAAVVRKFRSAGTEFLSFTPIESTGVHKTGGEFPIEFSAGIWANAGSFSMGVIIRDVTERKRREASFEMLFDRNPIPMWIFDAETLDFLSFNDAACTLYGYSREEALRRNALDVRLEEERDMLRSTIMSFGDFYQSERPGIHRTATGQKIRVMTFARRTRHADRDCVVVANIDVTERERALSELASTQIFLDAVVESIPSMVFVKDALDGRFILLNKAGERLLGISREELVGKTDFDLFDKDEAERFRQADREVVALGKLVTIENEPLSTADGIRSLRTQKIGVPDADGNQRFLLGISEDVTERLKVEDRNRHLSLHDILTDLPNRLSFQTCLDQHLSRPEGFALLLLDLDKFKAINDSLGHHAGDELLRQLSKRMLMIKGVDDILARLGGDEFGLIHRGDIGRDSVRQLAETLVSVVGQPFKIENRDVSVGCSIGIVIKPEHGTTADQLMKRGDLALYAAKAAGSSGHIIFEASMEEKADRERQLREELSSALSKAQLSLEYQPIVDTTSGKIVCCEALLRWRHPERGRISPAEFIPVAEASGLIEAIGKWVLQQACREAANWPENIKVAVNLSPKQFSGFELAATVATVLSQSGLSPNRLELEITESVFLTASEENVRLLNQLKTLGVGIALDDFGTGYSSLSYLRRFSFDKLKIDRSFVADLTSSQENLAIVRAVIGLGKSFSAVVTAEGVEDAAQFSVLADEGCDQCQGYLLSRPVSGSMIAPLLERFRYQRVSR